MVYRSGQRKSHVLDLDGQILKPGCIVNQPEIFLC